MLDASALLTSLGVLIIAGFLLWFALGTQRNIRKGNALLTWIQGGLPVLGKRTTLRWLGSSAVILQIVDPKRPFREAQVVVVMEPRDLSWLWAWGRSRGRRDFVIVRARLERSPTLELEAGDLRGWTGQDRLKGLDPATWDEVGWGDPNLRVMHHPAADPDRIRPGWDELSAVSGGVWRLSVRREPPHLEAHVLPPTNLGRRTSEPLFQAFRRLADQAMAEA